MKPQGIFPAVWVATHADGRVNWTLLERQLGFLLENGADGLMVLGTTGNFLFFSVAQRKEILERTVAACAQMRRGQETPLVVNISAVSLLEVVELGQHAADHGAAAVAVLPPWYYPATQPDLVEFYLAVARAVPVPLAIYNYPEVTGKDLALESVRQVIEGAPVYCMKQSGGRFEDHEPLLRLTRSLGTPVLTGWDTRLGEAKALGVQGSISGLSNAVGDLLARLWRSLQEGRDAAHERRFMTALGEKISALPFPHNIRAAIEARGIATGELINPASDQTKERYSALTGELRDLYQEWGLPPV